MKCCSSHYKRWLANAEALWYAQSIPVLSLSHKKRQKAGTTGKTANVLTNYHALEGDTDRIRRLNNDIDLFPSPRLTIHWMIRLADIGTVLAREMS
jgi:hypothetical protein